MHLRQLRHFLAVIDEGSLASAAKSVNISEPALSKSIRRLEDEIGAPLFDRGTRGMNVNAFGEALTAHARIIVSELRYARTEIDELKGVSKGLVRVGTQPSGANWLLPRAIGRMKSSNPGVRVTVVEGTVDLVAKVLAGDLDMIIVALGAAPPDPSLMQEAICAYPVTIIGTPQSLHRLGPEPGIAAIAAADWVVPRRPDPLRAQFEAMFLNLGVQPPDIAVETASAAMIRALVLESGCLSFMPVELFRDDIAAGTIAALPDGPYVWHRQIGLVRRRRTGLSPAARTLIQFLREEAAGNAALNMPAPAAMTGTVG